jgi:hypothetical protein
MRKRRMLQDKNLDKDDEKGDVATQQDGRKMPKRGMVQHDETNERGMLQHKGLGVQGCWQEKVPPNLVGSDQAAQLKLQPGLQR